MSWLRNSYTTGCPPVRGDNPRALDLAHREIFCAKVGKGGITSVSCFVSLLSKSFKLINEE